MLIMDTQKLGIDHVNNDMNEKKLSVLEYCFEAHITPTRIDNVAEISRDGPISIKEFLRAGIIKLITGACLGMEFPKSPRRTLENHKRYCSQMGLSNP